MSPGMPHFMLLPEKFQTAALLIWYSKQPVTDSIHVISRDVVA